MATENEPTPPAQKARTLAHMNNDHRVDMRHILLHYPAVPPVPPSFSAKFNPKVNPAAIKTAGQANDDDDPIMLDITLTSITLRLPRSDTVHSVAFNPPLAEWGERRARLVEMTKSARAALGIADGDEGVVVNEYMPPRVPYDLAIFLAVPIYYFCFWLVWMGWVGEGTVVGGVVEGVRFPGGVGGFTWLVRTIFWPVLGIHVAETWWLERSRLRRFGVRRGSGVWWLWVVSVFIEGAMAIKRFDIVVERLRREGKKER
jgi:hypothetical protein